MSDDVTRKLIDRAKNGDSGAIATIYQTHVGMIFRYIAYRVGSDEDAEDLTGEVFVKMVESLPRYQHTGAPFEAWLHRIAAARVADFYRLRNRQQEIALTENLQSERISPEERLVNAQEQAELRAALRELSEEEQTVLIYRFVERKSHKEVAEIIDKSVSAVKSIQHRALIRLASLMGSEEKVRHYLRGSDD
jgi:RNA polymerase sigma-70 factor (ECF subfamily)